MRAVLLNITMGERPDEPAELYKFATMVSIACGGTGVDERSIRRAMAGARDAWAKVVAHVSFPCDGDGRVPRGTEPEVVRDAMREQCAAILRVAEWQGSRIYAVKPHEALLEAGCEERRIADAVLDGAFEALGMEVPLVGPFEGVMLDYVRQGNLDYLREAFADRAYRPDGMVMPRREEGAIVTDPQAAAEQALTLARSGKYDVICVHADTPSAVAVAGTVRTALESRGLLSK
jgi:UPF0271 protein